MPFPQSIAALTLSGALAATPALVPTTASAAPGARQVTTGTATTATAAATTDVTTRWSQAAPVPGTYQVTVKHPTALTDPGTYRIDAEGSTVATADLMWDRTFTVTVTDGRLDLAFVGPHDLTGLTVYAGRTGGWPVAPEPQVPLSSPATAAQRLFPGYTGTRAGRPLSGVRVPRTQSLDELYLWGRWRGRQADAVMTYGHQDGYAHLAGNDWPVAEWDTFPGKLIYSLPLVPSQRDATLAEVAAGRYDATWDAVARQLRDHGRGDSLVRVGWEYNLADMPWGTTAATVGDFRTAFRRVVGRMRAIAPGLQFEFGINCGSDLPGAAGRLAPLTQGYPGDDVVDVVGCDVYDWWQTQGTTEEQWQQSLRPTASPGVADVVDFARAHGKLVSFAEWGLAPASPHGGGDDPAWIRRMNDFFVANRDVVALEAYFEDAPSMGNSLSLGQMPLSADLYRRLFGAPALTPRRAVRALPAAVRAVRVPNASEASRP